jgi:hypothetical protein
MKPMPATRSAILGLVAPKASPRWREAVRPSGAKAE